MEAVFYSLGVTRSNVAHIPGLLQLLFLSSYRSIEKRFSIVVSSQLLWNSSCEYRTREHKDMNDERRITFATYSKLMIKVSKYVIDTVVVQVVVLKTHYKLYKLFS